jgi:hypothetical protein
MNERRSTTPHQSLRQSQAPYQRILCVVSTALKLYWTGVLTV